MTTGRIVIWREKVLQTMEENTLCSLLFCPSPSFLSLFSLLFLWRYTQKFVRSFKGPSLPGLDQRREAVKVVKGATG